MLKTNKGAESAHPPISWVTPKGLGRVDEFSKNNYLSQMIHLIVLSNGAKGTKKKSQKVIF